MNNAPEFQIPYKAPLAEIPEGARKYAEMDKMLRQYRRDLRYAKRKYEPENVVQNIMQQIALIERAMENHVSGNNKTDV